MYGSGNDTKNLNFPCRTRTRDLEIVNSICMLISKALPTLVIQAHALLGSNRSFNAPYIGESVEDINSKMITLKEFICHLMKYLIKLSFSS